MIFINASFASKWTVENMMFNHNSCKNEGIFCTQLSSQKYRWILNSMAEHVWFLSAVCLGYSLDRLHISLIFGQLMPYWSAYFYGLSHSEMSVVGRIYWLYVGRLSHRESSWADVGFNNRQFYDGRRVFIFYPLFTNWLSCI